MSFRYDSARDWAVDHSLAAPLSLARLEAVAFQEHPEIYRHFGATGAALAETVGAPPRRGGQRAGGIVLGILAVIAAVAPLAGYGALVGDRFQFYVMPAERAVPFSGVSYAIAVVALVVALVVWLARGARWSPLLLGFAAVAALCAAGSSWTMPGVAEDAGYADWRGWHVVVLACLVVALVIMVAVAARFRVRGGDEPEETTAGPVTVGTVHERLAALSREERDAIRTDRDAALEVLHERGLLDAQLLERARDRELGTLYLLDGTGSN
ncbi:hypothetical protein ACQ143_11205 [Microbacterium sp. MC2]